jgi:hypothetical protein
MGCIYRPKYTVKSGERKQSGVYWIKYYRNGKPYRESTKSRSKATAKAILAQREAVIAAEKTHSLMSYLPFKPKIMRQPLESIEHRDIEGSGIYFIQQGDDGPVKIGYTERSVKQRIYDLQTASPFPLRLVGLITPAKKSWEKQIHLKFYKDKMTGEWFEPSPGLVDYISGLNGQQEHKA